MSQECQALHMLKILTSQGAETEGSATLYSIGRFVNAGAVALVPEVYHHVVPQVYPGIGEALPNVGKTQNRGTEESNRGSLSPSTDFPRRSTAVENTELTGNPQEADYE